MSLIKISSGRITIEADLSIPEKPNSLVVFSHGSGSGRFSPRNNFVAQQLQRKGIATLLADLLTKEEDEIYSNRFDIKLLSDRLTAITNWVLHEPQLKNLPIGYFGASTGAASALTAASYLPEKIKAVVSRGGRPDLASIDFSTIKAATLLIVGEKDEDVLRLNQKVYDNLHCTKQLTVVAGATHLFEEPGTLQEVAVIASDWFYTHLVHPGKKKTSMVYETTSQ